MRKIKFKSEKPEGGDGLPYGWFDKKDIKTYRSFYERLSDKAMTAEIGVWQGRSLCSIADIIKKKGIKVYAVDTFKGSLSAEGVVHDCKGRLKDIFEKNIRKFGLKENIIIMEMDSIKAIKKLSEKLDFIFIDADHTSEQVKRDILSWLPLVKNGGVLAGHAYNWVKEAVHKELEKKGFQVLTDKRNIYWIYKGEQTKDLERI